MNLGEFGCQKQNICIFKLSGASAWPTGLPVPGSPMNWRRWVAPFTRACPVGMIETSAALGASLLVLIVAVALDRRPYRPGKRNYIPIMIIAFAASLVLCRHLLTLMAYM
jgi:hypothetical protein